MTVRRGKIPVAPLIGNDLHLIVPGTKTTQAEVEEAVRTAYPLREYLAAGLVETHSVRSESGPHGRLLVEYEYRIVGETRNRSASSS